MNSVPAADSVEPVAPPPPRPPPARRTALLLEQTQPAGSTEQTAVSREGGRGGGGEGGRGRGGEGGREGGGEGGRGGTSNSVSLPLLKMFFGGAVSVEEV